MSKEREERERQAFILKYDLSEFPAQLVEMLYQHRDDPYFWLPRLRDRDYSLKFITERDEGRIKRRIRGSPVVTEKIAAFCGFTYEEWEYDDQEETAVVRREHFYRRRAALTKECLERRYKKGVMIGETVAIEYSDGVRVVEMIKPLDQPNGTVIYAFEKYQRGVEDTTESLKPSPQIELGSHCREDQPIGLEDYEVRILQQKYARGLLGLTEGFKRLGIPSSKKTWTMGKEVEAEVEEQGSNFVVKSQFGEVVFPRELNYEQVLESIKF